MLERVSLLVLSGILGCDNSLVVDIAPVLSSPHIVIAMAEDGTATIDATAVDPEGRPLTYAATRPAHGALTGSGPRYSYEPAMNYHGDDALTITISDGSHTLDVPVEITIAAVNDAPVAIDLAAITNEDQDVAVTLSATDDESTNLSYEVVTSPAHGTLTGHPPVLTYTPASHYDGSDTFTFMATDGEFDSNLATATISVTHVGTCGDGLVEGAEQCDDGNMIDDDACRNNCTFPVPPV